MVTHSAPCRERGTVRLASVRTGLPVVLVACLALLMASLAPTEAVDIPTNGGSFATRQQHRLAPKQATSGSGGFFGALKSIGESLMPHSVGRRTALAAPGVQTETSSSAQAGRKDHAHAGAAAPVVMLEMAVKMGEKVKHTATLPNEEFQVPPFEQLPSRAPNDGLDAGLVGGPLPDPLAPPFNGPNHKLGGDMAGVQDPSTLPDPKSLVPAQLQGSPGLVMTPSGALPPLAPTLGMGRTQGDPFSIAAFPAAMPVPGMHPQRPLQQAQFNAQISAPAWIPSSVTTSPASMLRFKQAPAAVPGAVPGALPAAVPGAVPGAVPAGPRAQATPGAKAAALGPKFPGVDSLSFPINPNLPNLDPKHVPSMAANTKLDSDQWVSQHGVSTQGGVPPNPNYLNPAPYGQADPYFNFVSRKREYAVIRSKLLREMNKRKRMISHYQAYVEGGDAWVHKMEDQLESWIRQERQRGEKSIVGEKKQVSAYKLALQKLDAAQKADAAKVNQINAAVRRAHYQYKLAQRKHRLQEALAHEKHLQSQVQMTAARKAQLQQEINLMSTQIAGIKLPSGKAAAQPGGAAATAAKGTVPAAVAGAAKPAAAGGAPVAVPPAGG